MSSSGNTEENMNHLGTILTTALTLYAIGTGLFLMLENRRPQATLAWMLAFFFAPGIGLLVYLLFGRDRKAFSKQSDLLRQDLEGNALPLLAPILSRQDTEIARLEQDSRASARPSPAAWPRRPPSRWWWSASRTTRGCRS